MKKKLSKRYKKIIDGQKDLKPLEPPPQAMSPQSNQQQTPGTYVNSHVTEQLAVREAGPLTTTTFPPLGGPVATKNDPRCAIHDAEFSIAINV